MSRMKDFLCGLADAQLAQFADILREQIAQRRMRGREYKSLRQNLELATMILLMRQKKKDLQAALDNLDDYEYDWQRRRDLQ